MIGAQVQKAVVETLKTAQVAGGAVYDRVPDNAPLHYVTVGDEQTIDVSDQCATLFDVFINVHVWSRNPGAVEAKRTGNAILRLLSADVAVEDYAVILNEFQTSRTMLDPDGLTTHGVMTFRFLLQQPE